MFWKVFIILEPPTLTFLKVNFDSNVVNSRGGNKFVIRGLDSRLIMTRDPVCRNYYSWYKAVSSLEMYHLCGANLRNRLTNNGGGFFANGSLNVEVPRSYSCHSLSCA